MPRGSATKTGADQRADLMPDRKDRATPEYAGINRRMVGEEMRKNRGMVGFQYEEMGGLWRHELDSFFGGANTGELIY